MKYNEHVLHYVRDRWLGLIDTDEFLRFKDVEKGNLAQTLSSWDGYALLLPWLLHPRLCAVAHPPTGLWLRSGNPSRSLRWEKLIAPTKAIVGIRSDHNFKLNSKVQRYICKDIFLQHEWGRGYRDILIKSSESRFPDQKKAMIEDIHSIMRIPPRLAYMGILRVALEKSPSELQHSARHFSVDIAKERELCHELNISDCVQELNLGKLQLLTTLARGYPWARSNFTSIKKIFRIGGMVTKQYMKHSKRLLEGNGC